MAKIASKNELRLDGIISKISYVLALGVIVIWTATASARASVSEMDLSTICDQAASHASQRTGVPITVLKAISLTETGRKRGGEMRPWPWTVNMEGKGVWFDDQDSAQTYVYKHYKRGARSFDVGCFQLNYKWHHQGFSSIEEMFDPIANAMYAANFLLDLYQEKGNWKDAAGAYHSRTPKYANKYKARFERFRLALANGAASGAPATPITPPPIVVAAAAPAPAPAPVPRVNHFPLLRATEARPTMGSLVPIASGNAPKRLIGVHE